MSMACPSTPTIIPHAFVEGNLVGAASTFQRGQVRGDHRVFRVCVGEELGDRAPHPINAGVGKYGARTAAHCGHAKVEAGGPTRPRKLFVQAAQFLFAAAKGDLRPPPDQLRGGASGDRVEEGSRHGGVGDGRAPHDGQDPNSTSGVIHEANAGVGLDALLPEEPVPGKRR
jgi:hypothetical protein